MLYDLCTCVWQQVQFNKYRHNVVTAVVVTYISFRFWVRGYGIKVFLGGLFVKLRKATLSFVMSALMEQLGAPTGQILIKFDI